MKVVKFKLLKDYPFFVQGEIMGMTPAGSVCTVTLDTESLEALERHSEQVEILKSWDTPGPC